MLYQNKALGQKWLGTRLATRLLARFTGKRYADLDLLSMSAHMQRDLGLCDAPRFSDGEIWRK